MREQRRYYQYGSVVEAPERIYSDPGYETRRKEERRRKLNEQNARRRAHKRSLRAAKLRLFSMSLTILAVGSMLFASVYLQNSVSQTKKSIAKLEDQITELTTQNAAAKSRIDTAVNLNFVRDKAINEMGMVYAGSDHIVYYEMNGMDYMVQY